MAGRFDWSLLIRRTSGLPSSFPNRMFFCESTLMASSFRTT
jgi:hypothetical protein